MRSLHRVVVAAVACTFATCARSADAALLYDLTASSGGTSLSGASGNWGFEFTAAMPLSVAALGLWDEAANGLAGPHDVGIFKTDGMLLVSAIVSNASTPVASASSGGGWLFTDLASSYALPAGTYVMGFFDPAGAGNDTFRGASTTNILPGATLGMSLDTPGAPAFASPTTLGPTGGWYGPNFSTVGLSPEPTSLALLAGVGVLHRRRREC